MLASRLSDVSQFSVYVRNRQKKNDRGIMSENMMCKDIWARFEVVCHSCFQLKHYVVLVMMS